MVQIPKNKQQLISVVMPVFNAEATIDFAIKSILRQTYSNFEFIIILDGSSDKTSDIVASFHDKRIKVILLKHHRGISYALNEGIKCARGTYIARMDSDDIAYPNRFALQVSYMKKHRNCIVLGTKAITINSEGRQIQTSVKNQKQIIHSTVLIRKKVFDQYGLYDTKLDGAEDYDLWLRLANKGEITILPKILLKYRRTKNAVSYQKVSKVYHSLLKAKIKAILKYGYSWWFLIGAIRPGFISLLPNGIKQKIYMYYYGITK